METEIIEALIPDLVNIVNEYLITPFEYYEQKYVDYSSLDKFTREYELKTASQLYESYKDALHKYEDYNQIFNLYMELILQEFKNCRILTSPKFKKRNIS